MKQKNNNESNVTGSHILDMTRVVSPPDKIFTKMLRKSPRK